MLPESYNCLQVRRQDSKHWWFLCPFHDDHNPSLSVNKYPPYQGFFKCWACGEYGTPADFAKKMGKPPVKNNRVRRKKAKAVKTYSLSADTIYDLQDKFFNYPDKRVFKALAKQMSVQQKTLQRFSVGYCQKYNAFTFPMINPDGEITGFRLRTLDGKKFAIKGSTNGLFIPIRNFNPDCLLFITEGESDCLAVEQTGFQVIGRPGSPHCKDMIGEWMGQDGYLKAVIVADNDKPGKIGAEDLADYLILRHGIKCKIIYPPAAYNDFREWFLDGASYFDVTERLQVTSYRKPVKTERTKNTVKITIGNNYATN